MTSDPETQRWMVVPMSIASAPGGPNLMISRYMSRASAALPWLMVGFMFSSK